MTDQLDRAGALALELTGRIAGMLKRERVPINPITGCALLMLAVSVMRRFGTRREGFLSACADCWDSWGEKGQPS